MTPRRLRDLALRPKRFFRQRAIEQKRRTAEKEITHRGKTASDSTRLAVEYGQTKNASPKALVRLLESALSHQQAYRQSTQSVYTLSKKRGHTKRMTIALKQRQLIDARMQRIRSAIRRIERIPEHSSHYELN